MLWAGNDTQMPNNYYFALAQYILFEKRFNKDVSLRQRYSQIIEDNIDKGHFFPGGPHDLQSCTAREWYLPNHPVIKLNKREKVRQI